MRRLSSLIALVVLCGISFAQSPHGKDFSTNCSDCHTTEGWKINRNSLNFNHDTLGFALVGQHKMLDCKLCHKTLLFTNTPSECMSCHTDIHYQTVGFECGRCHTPKSWIVENITEIHQLSRFPLVGPHVTADCYACHPSESLLRFEPLGVECFDCHQDKYMATTAPNHSESGYSTNCEECHLMTSFDWTGANINHSFFPLTGGHAIECIRCHTSGTFSKIPAECVSCHQADYNSTNDPNHSALGFSTDCNLCHSLNPGWQPAAYGDHDAQFFPIYSGKHNGTWSSCTECHTNPGDYGTFSCIDCHEHSNKADVDDKHNEVGGYQYNSMACYECHPTGSAEGGFNHSTSAFPLTGAHQTLECSACHANGFAGTPTICFACHEIDFNQSANPNHNTTGIATECETCHTTAPDWKPALFPQHNTIYPLQGAHTSVDCFTCHAGNYINTPNLCYGCHSTTYNQTTNPNHAAAQFPTNCESCHSTTAWTPATFDHDGLYFPIYSGKHQGTWNVCADCHTNSGNYAVYTCTSTCHPQGQTDPEHNDVGGYTYNDVACFECHPTGSADGAFNHATSIFPLTGAHLTTPCIECHANGFSGTPTICFACHETAFNQSVNPNHISIGIPTDCETCHSTNPGWQPAAFPIHSNYYALTGAHTTVDCFTCHDGNYINTPNLCYSCHSNDYNQTNNPNHAAAQFPTTCETCHSTTAWSPATFDHDGLYFPINSGHHLGTWNVCADCHTNPNNYAEFVCIPCHQQGPTDADHSDVGGYSYNSQACFECHPTGSAEGSFNHNNSAFPLTGAHITTDCMGCHANGWAGTPTICFACHENDFNQSINPNHVALSIPNDCETCHTTNPGWQPATFPIHNNYYALTGAHTSVDCNSCHAGDYNNTPNTCSGCHISNYNQTTNPDHDAIGIGTDCETCHTTNPGWSPATFPIHNNYWPLTGAHTTVDCYSCHAGNYNSTPNTCAGCHMADYNSTTDPNHAAAGFPTDCELCHTTVAWVPSTFDHDGLYFPIYSGSHAGVWTTCSECHPNPSNFSVFTCTTSCHPQSQMDSEHSEVTGYSYNSDACYACHPTGESGGKLMRKQLKQN